MRQLDMLQKGIDILEPLAASDEIYDEALMILAIGYVQLGDAASAEPFMEKALTANPDVPERLNALAQIYETLERDPTRIERLYQRALTIQPARADIRVNYGRFLDARGDIERAKEQYILAIEEQVWLETAYFNLGTAHIRSGEFDKAEEVLNQAIDLNPLNPESWSNLGILFASQNDMDAALSAFQAGVDADPRSAVALANLGTHHLSRDENEIAITYLERALEQDPSYLVAAANLALAFFRSDQFDKAGQQARNVLTIDPQNAIALQILQAI
jgi:Tfp pilus assembly protein PilF